MTRFVSNTLEERPDVEESLKSGAFGSGVDL